MIKFLSSLIFTIILVALAPFSHAGLLIEPQLGYILSGSSTFTPLASSYTEKYTGTKYGVKLGYQTFGVMGGLNYQHATYNLDSTCPSCSTTSATTSMKQDEVGVFVGVNAPILLRAWVGYNFYDKETATSTSSYYSSGNYHKGSSTELGAGFTGIPFLSLNLIYRMLNYTSSSANYGAGSNYSATPKELEIAVSLPLNLF